MNTIDPISNRVLDFILRWALRLEERVRFSLRRAVLNRALVRSYTAFARRRPRWSASLFDLHFLTHEAAAIFDQSARRDALPQPAHLIQAWLAQLGPGAAAVSQASLDEAAVVAAEFLRLLEVELQRGFWEGGDGPRLNPVEPAFSSPARASGVTPPAVLC